MDVSEPISQNPNINAVNRYSLLSILILMLLFIGLGEVMLFSSLTQTNQLSSKQSNTARNFTISSVIFILGWFVVALVLAFNVWGCYTTKDFGKSIFPFQITTKVFIIVVMMACIVGGIFCLLFSESALEANSTTTQKGTGKMYINMSYIFMAFAAIVALIIGMNYYHCAQKGLVVKLE